MAAAIIDQEEIESNLTAHYELQEFAYYPTLHVKVKSATSTRGSNLTGQDRDRTGIMIWPATHLLCQEMVSGNVDIKDGTVLELVCGCGVVGVVAAVVSTSSEKQKMYVSTDMDEKALELCHENYNLNAVDTRSQVGHTIRKLTWGNVTEMQAIQDDLFHYTQTSKFDSVIAADIVYPSTAGQVLMALFDTVDFFLRDGGTFYLSFATRDGYHTPQRLIEAASMAGFAISALPPISDEIKSNLPPLLDSNILLLERSNYAREVNNKLGFLDCKVFPNLKLKIQQAEEESTDEEWEAPGGFDFGSDSE
jgi:phospholipid N-methyltransferase